MTLTADMYAAGIIFLTGGESGSPALLKRTDFTVARSLSLGSLRIGRERPAPFYIHSNNLTLLLAFCSIGQYPGVYIQTQYDHFVDLNKMVGDLYQNKSTIP
jgi:hypothetical protein